MKTEKLNCVLSVRLPDVETRNWFLDYLKKNSEGKTVSKQLRAFILALKHKDIPRVTVLESAIKCETLQRALRYFCLKCRKENPELFKKCANRDWRQTQLGVR